MLLSPVRWEFTADVYLWALIYFTHAMALARHADLGTSPINSADNAYLVSVFRYLNALSSGVYIQ